MMGEPLLTAIWSASKGPTAAYYRKVAAEIRDLARRARQPEVRSEMADLAARFERMAAYVEKRFPNGRGRPSEDGHGDN
jgi:hypothetical protein